MKMKQPLAIFALCAATAFFAGCADLFGPKNAERGQAQQGGAGGTLVISLGGQGRYVAAADYDLTRVTTWTATFTNSAAGETYTVSTGDTSGASEPSLAPRDSGLEASNIPTGTYDVALEGRAMTDDGGTQFTVFGGQTNVVISSGSNAAITIYVGLKKSGTGNLSLTLADSDSALGNYIDDGAVVAVLTSVSDSSKTYSTGGANPALKLSAQTETNNSYTLAGSGIDSGWYILRFEREGHKISVPSDSQMIEIADGITTTGSATLSVSTVKTYYATNQSESRYMSYNGLAHSSPKNLTALFQSLAQNLPSESEIEIRMIEGAGNFYPEIDIAAFNALKTALDASPQSGRTLSVFNSFNDINSDQPALALRYGTADKATEIGIAIMLSATEGNTEFTADAIAAITTITLKNGASIRFSSPIADGSNTTILISAVDASGTADNLAAYMATPFLTAPASSYIFGDRIWLLEHGATASETTGGRSENYFVMPAGDETAGYRYYAMPMNSATIRGAEPFGGGVSIARNNFGEFTINETNGAYYAWYLDGALLNGNDQVIIGDPASGSKENLDYKINAGVLLIGGEQAKHTMSCYVLVGDTVRYAELAFTIESAAAWLDAVNKNASGTYDLKQLANYDSSAKAQTLVTGYATNQSDSAVYCFDNDFNLWTVEGGNSYTLKRYALQVSSGLYETTEAESVALPASIGSNSYPKDIYYDRNDGIPYLYILTQGDNIYAVSLNGGTPTVVNDSGAQITFPSVSGQQTSQAVQIAVSGNTIYVAGNDNIIYQGSVSVTDNSVAVVVSSPSAIIASSEVLKGYEATDSGTLSITDLQIGDGYGNNWETLYALVRHYSSVLSNTVGALYSRGALVSIDTATTSSVLLTYGWSTTSIKAQSSGGSLGGGYTFVGGSFTFYAPTPSASSVDFFGPTHFAALVPNALVILDDGVSWDSANTRFSNQDSLVEFDIAAKTLTRGASISASVPTASGFEVWTGN